MADQLSDAAIKELELGDAHLLRIEWPHEHSPDLRLILDGRTRVALLFTWVNGLRISLDFSLRFKGLTSEVRFHRMANNRWRVEVDFPGEGTIEFECQAIIKEPVLP
jgi:hypothetical protein